jgi:hypothetical protein
VLLGSGEHLFGGLDLCALGYTWAGHFAGERATHVILRRGALTDGDRSRPPS